MIIEVKYSFNRSNNSGIEEGIEILELPEYDYDEIMAMDKEGERIFIGELKKTLENNLGYYSVKVTSFSEL